jgi:hypothetical protein
MMFSRTTSLSVTVSAVAMIDIAAQEKQKARRRSVPTMSVQVQKVCIHYE